MSELILPDDLPAGQIRVTKRIEPVFAFESRISGNVTGFDTPEERPERPIDAPHGFL